MDLIVSCYCFGGRSFMVFLKRGGGEGVGQGL